MKTTYEIAKHIIARAIMAIIWGHTCTRLCPKDKGLKTILAISEVVTALRNKWLPLGIRRIVIDSINR
jgi:hypothetical protein